MHNKVNKKRLVRISVFVISVFTIFFSVTYAFITQTLISEKKQVINAGILDLVLEEEKEITLSDALPMYDEVGMIQEDVFKFRLVNKTSNDTKYILKLEEVETGTLAKSDVKYGLIKNGETKIDFLSNLTNMIIDSGKILGNATINYELRLWVDSSVADIEKIEGKFLSLRMVADVSQEIEGPTGPINEIVFDEEMLGTNCKTYDDGVDTFLVGRCSQNYVWYSGKLWRVVLKNNSTGAVKMTTFNSITSMAYNETDNSSFENSYADQWLNQEFLATLHDYSDYLVVNSTWDITEDSNAEPTRLGENTIDRTVGLLSAYEYFTTYNKSDGLASAFTGYLNIGVMWWLMTPQSTTRLWRVLNDGTTNYEDPASGIGICPSVNLKPTIKIKSGTGTQSDPYILEGDLQETVNGITHLSTRYSGEYITFNNELYRIVGIEDGLTKITAVDKPTSLLKNKFHSTTGSGVSTFATSSIKTELENYYQSLNYSNKKSYDMIHPNTKWYLKGVQNGANYKSGSCAIIDTNVSMNACEKTTTTAITSIGLPRVGEMFTSLITRKSKNNASFFTLTSHNVVYARTIFNNGCLNYGQQTSSQGARPSMYLKSNVVIASNNTGNGTYEYPYSIELDA